MSARTIQLLIVASVLAGCSHKPMMVTSTPAEQDAALRAFFLCFENSYATYDDGVSPAPLVARAIVQSACQPEAQAYGEVKTRGISYGFGQPVRDWIMGGGPFVDLVLRERAERRNKGAH